MTLPAPTYDLVLLLDPQAEESVRAKILDDTRATIEAHGELLRHDEWGERQLTYPIEKKTSAEYHLLQFHAGTVELLAELDRTLRITDGVMRFRLIKLRPGVPDAPDMRSSSAPARRVETEVPAEPQPDGEVEVEVELVAAEPA
jgi:small subunit ribosomal protein S6